jgi:hypothetical protein
MKGILEAYPVKQANLCTFHLKESLSRWGRRKNQLKMETEETQPR